MQSNVSGTPNTPGSLMDLLTFPLKDPQWQNKVLIGAGINIIPFIGQIINFGYSLEVMSNVRTNQSPAMPAWADKYGKFLSDGLILFLIFLVYSIPVVILSGISTGIAASSIDFVTGRTNAAAGIFAALFGLLILVYAIFEVFWMQGVLINFSINRNFASGFDFSRILSIIMGNWKQMLMIVLVYFVVGIILWVVSFILVLIPCIGWIALWVISLASIFYLLLILAYNCGLIAKRV